MKIKETVCMKKILILLLAFVCISSSAYAHPWAMFNIKYNSAASTLGAPKAEKVTSMTYAEPDDSIYADFGNHVAGFVFSGDDPVSVLVRAYDDSTDFLMTCMTVISVFGGFDVRAFGHLLYQFARIRNGNETDPFKIGPDAFQFIPGSDGYAYHFVYLNNDHAYAD